MFSGQKNSPKLSPANKMDRKQEYSTIDTKENSDSDGLLQWKDEDNTRSFSLFIGSWNLHGKSSPTESIQAFLPVGDYDMYVVGTQECERSIEASLVLPTNKIEWETKVSDTMGPEYTVVGSQNFGALDLIILVRNSLVDIVTNVMTDTVSTGFGNVLNNKGAIAISLFVGDTSFLFVNAHFAAYQNNVTTRNEDFHRINENIFNTTNNLRNSFSSEKKQKRTYNRTFFFGDLNYRIDGDRGTVERLIESNRLDILLPHDQLLKAKKRGQIFVGFVEGNIKFAPTYKFDTGTDIYDSSAKARIPAWTDRILWKKSESIRQLEYNSVPKVTFSDHKPVYSTFEIIYSINGNAKEETEDDKPCFGFSNALCKCPSCTIL